jgi:N4-gp56 family major capsid protein
MEVALATASEKQVWKRDYLKEYVRESGFMPYMGRGPTSIIMALYELQEQAGKTVNMPLITRLTGTGVTGSSVLDGNEEDLGNYNCGISVDWLRNGVRVPKSTSFKTEIDLLGAAKAMLKQWSGEHLRDDIIQALLSCVTTGDTTVNLADSSSTNRNAYAAGNSDRLLFGKLVSNYSATFATALGNIDTTDDKCTAASMSLAKRLAKLSDPHIRPFKTESGREFYVAFHGSRTFRDLKADSTISQVNRDARPRSVEENPLFQDGDLLYDGILHREVPEIDNVAQNTGGAYGATGAGTYSLDAKGNTSADVRPVFLCGQQAVGVAWGQEPSPKTDMVKDYGFRPGVAIEELRGVKKAAFNGKQHGVLTAYFAAAADS